MKTSLLNHFFAFILITGLSVFAQNPLIPVITLNDGRYIEGTITEMDSSFVLIAHPDNTLFTLSSSQVAHTDSISLQEYVDMLDEGKFYEYARRMQKLVEDDDGFFTDEYPNEIGKIRLQNDLDTLITVVYLIDGRYIEGSILSKDSTTVEIIQPDKSICPLPVDLVAIQDTLPAVEYLQLLSYGKIFIYDELTQRLKVDYYGFYGSYLYINYGLLAENGTTDEPEQRLVPYSFDLGRYIGRNLPYVVLKTHSNKYIEGLLVHEFRKSDFYTGHGSYDMLDSDDELLLSQSDESIFRIKRGMLTVFTAEDVSNYLEFVKSGKKWSYSHKSGEFILQDREYQCQEVTEDYFYVNNELIDEKGRFRDFFFKEYLKSEPDKTFFKSQSGQYITGQIVEQDKDNTLINVNNELQLFKTSEISTFNYLDSVAYLKRSLFYDGYGFSKTVDEPNVKSGSSAGLAVLNVLYITAVVAISLLGLFTAALATAL